MHLVRRRIVLVAVMTLVCTGVSHAQTRKNRTEADRQTLVDEDLAQFQGTWRLISVDGALGKVPAEALTSNRVTYRDNLKTVTVGKRVMAKNVRIELDPTATPKRINESVTTPQGELVTILGIYKIEGDTLTICAALEGQRRPTRFLGGPQAGATLQVLKRAQVASKTESPQSPTRSAVTNLPEPYVSRTGRFRFRFPVKPEVADQKSQGANGSYVLHSTLCETPDKTVYGVTYIDLAPATVRGQDPDALLDGGVNGLATTGGWKISSTKAIQLDAYPGRDVVGELRASGAPEVGVGRTRMYLVENRLYQVIILGPKSRYSPSNATKYLDSFELVPEAPATATTRKAPARPAPGAARPRPVREPMVKRAPRPGNSVAARTAPRTNRPADPVTVAVADADADAGPDPTQPAEIAIAVNAASVRLVDLPRGGDRRRPRGVEFRETAPKGGLLVGVRVGYIGALGGSKVGSIQPIFQAGGSYVVGARAGAPVAGQTTVVAKPGYAVGGINTRSGLLLDAFQVVFMKYEDGRLDPHQSYASAWLGDPSGGKLKDVSGDGKIVMGFHGVTNQREVNALGVIVAE